MNPLWMLDAPFWQKLYFISMAAGASLFVYFMIQLATGWNTKLKRIIAIIRKELALEKERRKAFFKKVKHD